MTFSFSTSGTCEQVKKDIGNTAFNASDNAVDVVARFLIALVDETDRSHGVAVSASGHTGPHGTSGYFNVRPLPVPTAPPAQDEPHVL